MTSKRDTARTYKNWIMRIKLNLITLKARGDEQLFLLLHGTPMQKRHAKTALKGIREQIKQQKKALKVKMSDCEKAYTRRRIEKFWKPSWKQFLSPVTV